MPISPGTRLGPYEIVQSIGAGGMGEVYRARDIRLERHVALKLVLEAFVADADRAMRFEREAKTLASLNHPNIATLHGLDHADGRHFLVMEFVDGETLAERIARQPAGLPLDDALRIACQIAEALEAAHEKGITHRDLKPANVKITPDDKVKVLDFGLARVASAAAGTDAGQGLSPGSMAQSPTFTSPAHLRQGYDEAGTEVGVILGTASYMSPEQARGHTADHRSDIFSFGVVLYEMLTGRQPFPGETIADVLAAVLTREPDLATLPAGLSVRLTGLLKRCLDKNPKKRWQAIGDLRYELESILVDPRAGAAVQARPAAIWRRAVPLVVAAASVAIVLGAIAWALRPTVAPLNVARFSIPAPDGKLFSYGVAISPDGKRIAFVAGGRTIYLRELAAANARVIHTSEESVNNLTFSPDGQALAFWKPGAIMRIPAMGGVATAVTAVGGAPWGMSWSGDWLIFNARINDRNAIVRVRATGGDPETLLELPKGEQALRPQMLPDGQTILFTNIPPGRSAPGQGPGLLDSTDRGDVVAQRIGQTTRTTLVEGASDARLVNTGHIVFMRKGVLFASAFDPSRLSVVGPAVPVVEGVRRAGLYGQYALGPDGTLVFQPGPVEPGVLAFTLSSADPAGTALEVLKIPQGYLSTPRVSPNGRYLAYANRDGGGSSIWIYDLEAGGVPRRLTFDGHESAPIWTADSTRVTFSSEGDGRASLWWQRSDGTGVAEQLTNAEQGEKHMAHSWSPNANVLLFDSTRSGTATLMMLQPPGRAGVPFGGVVNAGILSGAEFSPNGKWVAYVRQTTERTHGVFVRPFPASGTQYQVSRSDEDAFAPVWSADGQELLYHAGLNRPVMAVRIVTAPVFTTSEGRALPRTFVSYGPGAARAYDIAPSGRMYGVTGARPADETGAPPALQVVLNWFEELKAKVPSVR